MALKPFYNKKGHLGMTRQQLLEKLNGGGGGSENGPKIVGTIYFNGGTGGGGTIAANSVGLIRVADAQYIITGAYDYNNEEIADLATKLSSGLYSIIISQTSIGNDLHILGCSNDGRVTTILNMTNSSQSVDNLDWYGILIRNYES